MAHSDQPSALTTRRQRRFHVLRGAGAFAGLALLLAFLLEPVDLAAGRHGPDGRNYLGLLHSLLFDRDLLLYNDNALFGQRTLVTPSGYALELHNVGTALALLPFYALGTLTCQITGSACTGDNLPANVWLSLGNWTYGLLGLVFMWRLVERHTAPRWATLAVGGLALGSSFFYYWTRFFNPHMPALFLVSLLALVWDRTRDGRAWHGWLLLGLLGGAAAGIANYNAAFLLLPACDWAAHAARWLSSPRRAEGLRLAGRAALLGAGALIGFSPQAVAWRLLFGSATGIPYGQQIFWLQPGLPDLLFSSYHGLYFYAPVLLLATLGFVPLFRRSRRQAVPLFLTLAALVYVAACNIAWWGGASFGARYLLGSLVLLALPLAVLLERARWKSLLYAGMGACLAWNYGLFLADFGRLIDPGQYIPWRWQLQVQARVLSEAPELLRRHLLSPRFEAAPLVALPAALLLGGVSWLAVRARRMPGSVLAVSLAGAALVTSGLLAASEGRSRAEIARLEAAGALSGLTRASYDRYDLSEGYWQRGAYRFVRGELPAARADFERAQQIDPSRGWVRLHAAGRRHVPHPLEWSPAPGLALVGWETAPGSVTLYWLAGTDLLSPAFRTALRLEDAAGGTLGTYRAGEPDGWRALAGDLVRVTYPLTGPAPGGAPALGITLYPAGGEEPLGDLLVALDAR